MAVRAFVAGLLDCAAVSEVKPTRVLRSTLEQALETHVASTVLFEALGSAGQTVPQTREDVLRVVEGPLRRALARRLDAGEADLIVQRIAEQLAPPPPPSPEDLSTVELPLDDLAEETRPQDATTAFPTAEAVPVLVLSSGPGFAHRLELALGEQRVKPRHVDGPTALKAALEGEPPAIVLLDAADFPALERSAILSLAHGLPATTACVLWGAELPFGRRFVQAIEAQGRRWVVLELKEGIAPLLDLIRSRRRRPNR